MLNNIEINPKTSNLTENLDFPDTSSSTSNDQTNNKRTNRIFIFKYLFWTSVVLTVASWVQFLIRLGLSLVVAAVLTTSTLLIFYLDPGSKIPVLKPVLGILTATTVISLEIVSYLVPMFVFALTVKVWLCAKDEVWFPKNYWFGNYTVDTTTHSEDELESARLDFSDKTKTLD